MKKTIVVCDVTGDEGGTLSLRLNGLTRTSRLDAAGDTDEEIVSDSRTLDLSHGGALRLIQAMWQSHKDANNWPGFDSMRYLDECVNRAKGLK